MNYVGDEITDILIRWLKENNNVTFLFFYVLQKKSSQMLLTTYKIHTCPSW